MPIDSVTNFIVATDTLMRGVETALAALVTNSTFTGIDFFDDDNTENIFDYLQKAQTKRCVVRYDRSTYNQDSGPRRVTEFTVFCVHRYTTNRKTAQTEAFTAKDAVIGILDHLVVSGHAIIRVQDDSYLAFPHSALTVYAITFNVEDY